MGARVRGWRGSDFGVGGAWVASVHKILTWVSWVAWVKKGVSDMGRNFGVGRVGFRCFVKKVLLKVSQNLQESTCAGVSC